MEEQIFAAHVCKLRFCATLAQLLTNRRRSVVVTGTPSEPVYSGGTHEMIYRFDLLYSNDDAHTEIQVKDLGMKVEVFDPSGRNIEHTGLPGELVCTRPHPSLPLGFWGDESGQKLRDAYFNTYPGLWPFCLYFLNFVTICLLRDLETRRLHHRKP